jgi:hypothetical protein
VSGLHESLREEAQSQLLGHYRLGWFAGTETALNLVLGREDHGGIPYLGPIPPELRVWAEQALSKMGEAREEFESMKVPDA